MFKAFRAFWRLIFAAFLVISLVFNLAILTSNAVLFAASAAVNAVTGLKTVAMQHANEVAELGGELAEERAARRKLRGELTETTGDLAAERAAKRKLRTELTETTGELATDRGLLRKLRGEMADPLSRIVTFRGEKVAMRQAVDTTADRISKRAVKTSAREVGSMAGEALPYVGAAVIIGATAMELKDLCDTLKDMTELRRALDPASSGSKDERTVCAQHVPSKEELWEQVKASPERAWNSARDAVPSLEEIKNYEMPDVDWTGVWASTVDGSTKAWAATKGGAGSAMEATSSTVGGWINGAKGIVSSEEEDAVEALPPAAD